MTTPREIKSFSQALPVLARHGMTPIKASEAKFWSVGAQTLDKGGVIALARELAAQDALAPIEQQALAQYEQVIASGLQTFIAVGEALADIREGRLYRAAYATFEDYCRERWGIGASRARQLIGAAETYHAIESVTTVTVANEAQVRPLAGLSPEQQRQAWRAAEAASGGKVTAKAVQQAVEAVKPKPAHDQQQAIQTIGLAPSRTAAPPGYDFPADYAAIQRRHEALGARLYWQERGGVPWYTTIWPGGSVGITTPTWSNVVDSLAAQERKQAQQPAIPDDIRTHACERCGQPATDKRTTGGLSAWRCAACAALATLCERTEQLGATIDYTATREDGRLKVLPPEGYQQVWLWCDAGELGELCARWERHGTPTTTPTPAPHEVDWDMVKRRAHALLRTTSATEAWEMCRSIVAILAQRDRRAYAVRLLQLLAPLMAERQSEDPAGLAVAIDQLNACVEGSEGLHWVGVGWALLDVEPPSAATMNDER